MDDNRNELFEASREDIRSAYWDLVIDYNQFEPQLLGLGRRVGSKTIVIDQADEYDPDSGKRILATALVAASDLPPGRGRIVSAEYAVVVEKTSEGFVPRFYVARRLDGGPARRRRGCCWRCRIGVGPERHRGRTRLRIWVPRTTHETWLVEFDGAVLKILELQE
jgi:hypothetical protein